MQPQTRYALSGDVNIAYQVIGDGPIDLVFVMGWVSNIDEFWTEPSFANFLQRLARFSRLIVFDKRGTGLSDRVDENNLPTLEQRMDDVRAVMDAAGSRRAALLGISEGGPMCILFAATYPGAHRRADDVRLRSRGRSPRPTIRGAETRKPIAASWRRYGPAGARSPSASRTASRPRRATSASASGGRATSCAARARARCWRSRG